jgi:GNAT superfamily N-acetyltransferase
MRRLPEEWRFNTTPGILTLTDANTTIGYCRYDAQGEIEYLFVNPAFRRQGVATALLRRVLQETGIPLRFQDPLSPLGKALVSAWENLQTDKPCT